MDERGKISVLEREIAAWNKGDMGGVIAELDEEHEWDLTRSDIPGEKEVHRGHDAYLGFARRWRVTRTPGLRRSEPGPRRGRPRRMKPGFDGRSCHGHQHKDITYPRSGSAVPFSPPAVSQRAD